MKTTKKPPISSAVLGYIEGMKMRAAIVTQGRGGPPCGPLIYQGQEIAGIETEAFLDELVSQLVKRGFEKSGFSFRVK